MQEAKTINLLLFLILLALIANIFVKVPSRSAIAETFKLDECITSRPSDKPAAYLHVIQH